MSKILVTGGAGYVGSALVPELIKNGYEVNVLDLYLYGDDIFSGLKDNKSLKEFKGDLRDQEILKKALDGCNNVIHLACISNDPSFELNPDLGRSINFDAFEPLVKMSQDLGIERFIYASSSSVYGVKDVPNVTEDMELEPLTDYSKYKAMCEEVLAKYHSEDFCCVTVRPATVCGYAKRQRLDVIVNILANHAYNNGKIKIFGGEQKRPNINIKDMVRCYLMLLKADANIINGKIYNAGYQNHTVSELGEMVRSKVGEGIELEKIPTDDNRSYHISSKKILEELNFKPEFSVEDAIDSLVKAFNEGLLPNSMEDSKYYNIKKMQEVELS